MDVLRELLDLLSGYSIDQSCLTNTVSSYETIFTTLDQFKLGLLKQSLTTNDESKVGDKNVTTERVCLVVDDCGRGNAALMLDKFFNFFVKGILHSVLFFRRSLLSAERVLFFCIVVTFGLLSVKERVQKFFLTVDT